MKEKLFANWGLKLIALLVAFGLWYVWAYTEDPLGESTYTNIEVQFLNQDLLQEQNLVSEVLDGTDVVRRVLVKGRRRTLDQMRDLGASVIATADFAKLNREDDTIPITFSVPSRFAGPEIEISLLEGSPVVKLLVEELKSKNVRVEGWTAGSVKEGYQIVETRTDVNTITVTGGKSKVDQVYCAAVVQDVSGSSEDIISTGSILLYNKDKESLDTGSLQRSLFTTGITVRIYPVKEVPVIYTPFGLPAEGYQATGVVDGSIKSVKVVGSSNLLNSLERVNVGGYRSVVDISDATEDKKASFNIKSYLPNGVSLAADAGDGNGEVTVYIEPEVERQYKVQAEKIRIENVPEGYLAELSEEYEAYDLTLKGLAANLDKTAEEELSGVADVEQWMKEEELEEITPGTYSIPVVFELLEGLEEVDPVKVMVTFQAEEELESRVENREIESAE